MQQTQQSNPPQSQSRHLVLPGAVPPGLMIELVAEPGRTKLTGLEVGSVHMAFEGNEGRQGGRQWAFVLIYIYGKMWSAEIKQLLNGLWELGKATRNNMRCPSSYVPTRTRLPVPTPLKKPV